MSSTATDKLKGERGWSWSWWMSLTVVAVGVACAAAGITWAVLHEGQDEALLRMLHSPSNHLRKQGAWIALDWHVPGALEFIAQQVERDAEPVADVRECYVYALGRSGEPKYFDLVAKRVRSDPSGYVRQAAWLAAARIDAQRFEALVRSQPPSDDPWDRIGRAIGWLEIGDVRGLPTLLEWVRRGDADQQLVVCAALYRGLRPLLEAAGRWPLGAEVGEGEVWSADLLDEVERRCAELDLQRIADDTRPHLEAAALVRRNAHRMTSARNWIAWFLYLF